METGNAEDVVKSTSVMPNDQTTLLNIFPELVWLAVFGKVKSSDDLIKISNSSLFFRNLLLFQRTLFLFPKIWQILGMVYETAHGPKYIEDNDNEDESEEPETKWFSDVLKQRQVCKMWCSAVDSFYSNFPGNYRMFEDAKFGWTKFPSQYRFGFRYTNWPPELYLDFPDDARIFRDHFRVTHEGTHRSPLLANAVSFKVNSQSVPYLSEILELYGKHVWHCRLGVDDGATELSSILVHLLKLMPNLRSLRIRYNVRAHAITNMEYLQHICANLLPIWQNLTFLEAIYIPGALLDSILVKNNHFEMIEVYGDKTCVSSTHPCLCNNIFTYELPNLSQMSLQIYCKEYFEQLNNYPIELKLEKIYIDFSKCCFVPWSEIFKVLESRWADTATNVALCLPRAENFAEKHQHKSDFFSLQLNPPHLKRLKLIFENAPSIDFILPMKDTLARLEIKLTDSWNDRMSDCEQNDFEESIKSQIIEFDVFQYDFCFSNIWDLLPALQHLEYLDEDDLEGFTYTRQKRIIGKMKTYYLPLMH